MDRRAGLRCPTFFSVIACALFLSLVNGRGVCPSRCLCYIDANPRSISCANQGLEDFPRNMSDLVEHLDLSHNVLVELPDDLNRLSDLKYLNLAANRLTSLPANLQNLRKLRKLDLSNNLILQVESIMSISQLSSIMILHLSGNSLLDLQGLNSEVLQALDASNCEIKEFNNKSLEGLPALSSLSLARNPLNTIDMPSSSKLRWLDMSNCLLNYLTPDTFINLPELEELRLANNPKLVFSTRQSTLTHKNLKKLDASRCNLDRPGLHGLPLLNQARLSHNVIRLLPNRIFAKNRHLTHLYLDGNAVDQLHVNTFEGLVKLQVLDLAGNAFEDSIHWATFQDNLDLRLLNLSYNALYHLPNFTSTVISLDVSDNFIEDVKEDCLTNMPRIRILNLGSNRLQAVPPSLKSPTLRVLDLKRNRLVQLTNKDFADLPSLQRLDLSGNRLTEAMSPTVFENNPNLETILLSDNPWRCDCNQLYVTFEFLTEYSSKTASSTLICQSPANASGYTWETACFDAWNRTAEYNSNRTWGFVLISFLVVIVFFGSVVSLRHSIMMKRRAAREREQLQRAEARERLRLLQRRNQQRLGEELFQHPAEPRIHPMELTGPPSYEEAVQMPRLTHSLNALDNISVDNGSTRVLGSVDNLRAKKRRSRRPRKRARSEDDLLKRQERRIRRISRERDGSTGNVDQDSQQRGPNVPTNSKTSSKRRGRRPSVAEVDSGGSSSHRDRPRPQTPSAVKKKRRRPLEDGHSTDDEDSDLQNVVPSRGSLPIRELRREPRSGFRESVAGRSSDS